MNIERNGEAPFVLKLALRDWIWLVMALAVQAMVVISAWWNLSDRVLTLEVVASTNSKLIDKLADNQDHMMKLIEDNQRRLDRMPR